MATSIPVIRFFEWDTSEIATPVGVRTTPGASFAFKQIIASGCQTANPNFPASTSGTLIFEGTTFEVLGGAPPSHLESKVIGFTVNLATSGNAISDMRLYLTDDSALVDPAADVGLDSAFIQITASGGSWLPFSTLASGVGTRLTKAVPSSPNILRQDGVNALLGQDDQNSSEFIYMNLVIPFNFPIGTFGICGSGNLRFGFSFNYWSNDYILEFGEPLQP